MNTKMDVRVVITPKLKSKELYDELAAFNADVRSLGNKIQVSAEIDIREDVIEKILDICREYGDCEVNAQMK